MLQANEIQRRFDRIEQAIRQASQSVGDGSVSPELKSCIEQLDRQSGMCKQVLQSRDESKMRDAVDNLEMLGDETKRALRTDTGAPPQVREALTRVHDELSDLKHQLH